MSRTARAAGDELQPRHSGFALAVTFGREPSRALHTVAERTQRRVHSRPGYRSIHHDVKLGRGVENAVEKALARDRSSRPIARWIVRSTAEWVANWTDGIEALASPLQTVREVGFKHHVHVSRGAQPADYRGVVKARPLERDWSLSRKMFPRDPAIGIIRSVRSHFRDGVENVITIQE